MQTKTQIGILIFLLFTLIYFLSAKGNLEISDTYFSVQTAKSIVTNLSLSPEGCRKAYCYQSEKDNKYYPRYGLGLSFLFIPAFVLSQITALCTGLPENQITNFLISFYNIFFGAGAAVVMFYMVKFFCNSNRVSLNLALLLGLGTFCWRYSIWDFSETTQMFFLFTSIYCALKNSPKSLILGGVSFCCLLLIKAIYIVYVPIFLFYICSKNWTKLKQTFAQTGLFLGIVLLGFSFILFLNYIRFGNLLEFGYGLEANNFFLSGITQHTPKLLYWLDKGIFIYNPIFILGILGYYKLFKSFGKEAVFFISIIGINFVLTSMWYGWHGNWSWGPRLLVPTAPLWLIPCFFFLDKKGPVKILLISLIFISVLIQGLSILTGNLEYLTLCNANQQEGVRKKMPAQIIGSLILLKHKIVKKNSLYNLSEFGINSDTEVDTSEVISYRGFDFWYLNAARYFNKPILKYIPVLFFPIILALLLRLFKITAAT